MVLFTVLELDLLGLLLVAVEREEPDVAVEEGREVVEFTREVLLEAGREETDSDLAGLLVVVVVVVVRVVVPAFTVAGRGVVVVVVGRVVVVEVLALDGLSVWVVVVVVVGVVVVVVPGRVVVVVVGREGA